MVAVTLGLAPYAGWLYTACAVVLGGWFLAEAHRLRARVAAMPGADDLAARPGGALPAPARDTAAAPAGGGAATAVDLAPRHVAVAGDRAMLADGLLGGGTARGQESRGSPRAPAPGLIQPSVNPAPMRLFHLSIAYLTLLFAVIAVTAVLPGAPGSGWPVQPGETAARLRAGAADGCCRCSLSRPEAAAPPRAAPAPRPPARPSPRAPARWPGRWPGRARPRPRHRNPGCGRAPAG